MYLIPNYSKLSARFLPDNISLLLNRFLQMVEQDKNGQLQPLKIQKVKDKVYRTLRSLRTISDINSILSSINRRMQIFLKSYQYTTSFRLIVGLGSTSVLETSIKLHHIYGVPYIPSSAVKGVLRAYKMWKMSNWDSELLKAFEIAIREIYEKCKNPLVEFNKKLQDIESLNIKSDVDKKLLVSYRDKINEKFKHLFEILSIFGTQNHKGCLTIFDAYPESFNGFDIDIMNPHYPEYYQSNEPPADWQNPNPIKFLAIPAETRFNFYFLNPYEKIEEDIKNALKIIGIGAKTALGYGVFTQ